MDRRLEVLTVGPVTMPLLPIFPLSSVLVPGAPLPLHIFEPRYRQLMKDLLELPAEDRRFGVIGIRRGRETGVNNVDSMYPVGCVTLITAIEAMADGGFDIETVGVGRFRLGELDLEASYLRSDVEVLPEDAGDAGSLPAAVSRGFTAYLLALASAGREVPAAPVLPSDPLLLSYLVAATVVLDAADRQELLEAEDAVARLAIERRLLTREVGLLHAVPSVPGNALMHTGWSVN